MRRVISLIVVLFLSFVHSLIASDLERLILPEGGFYYQPAASVYGLECAWVNPAGLAHFNVTGYQVMADYFDKKFAKTWGFVIQRERMAGGYRHVYTPLGDDFTQYLLSVGFQSSPGLGIGFSFSRVEGGPQNLSKQNVWEVAFQKKGNGPVSWGAVFSNLSQAKVNKRYSKIEQRYSLAYRPLGDKFTFAADMLLSTGIRLADATYIYHVEYTPIKGLYVAGFIDSHRNFQIGIRANLLNFFVGAKSSFTRSGHERGSTVYVGSINLKQPSLISAQAKNITYEISGSLPENPPQPFFGRKATPYITQLLTIYRAAEDPSVKELLVKIRDASFGFAKAQELREAFSYFKSRGKRLFCFLENPSNISYYLGSIADSIIIPPVSQLNLVGLRSELTFYAGTLEKLGVKIDMVRIGDYKSAAESYTRAEASEENQQQLNRLLDNLYSQFTDGITSGRSISKDSVKTIIDNGPYTSSDAFQAGLVDGLYYEDQLDSVLHFRTWMSASSYRQDTLVNESWKKKPVLAIVVAEGDITSDGGDVPVFQPAGEVTPWIMDQGLKMASTDSRVKGIVFRINSPGGSALASDYVHRSALKASQKRPFVVSMSDVAASGGYYIAMPAKRVFADPGTITGSIGIFGGKADFSGLNKKIALGKELYTRGRFAGMMSSVKPFTDEERAKYFDQIKAFYDHFVDLVAGNRSLKRDSVNALGEGRVWTGQEAVTNGLVDEIGGLKKTLDYVSQQAGLKDYTVEVYPYKRPFLIWPFPTLSQYVGRVFAGSKKTEEDPVARLMRLCQDPLLARIPYDIVVE